MEEILELKNLAIGYTHKRRIKTVCNNINESLYKGELVCLLGPNGAGKSTLIRTIAGAQKSIGGDVLINDRKVESIGEKQLAKKISLVLTDRIQSGILTAYDVVAYGRYPHTDWSGKFTKSDHEIIKNSIITVGAEPLVNRALSELSDGERQKIMVARALAQETPVMILDEVTAFLDLPRRVEIMHLLQKLAHTKNKAILLSTHDMDLALRCADKLWLLPKDGPLYVGGPEDLILNNIFEKVFADKGVSFNIETGAFQAYPKFSYQVALEGEGNLYNWTKRALERTSITLNSNAAIKVEIESKNDTHKWIVRSENKTYIKNNIYNLTYLLRQIFNSK